MRLCGVNRFRDLDVHSRNRYQHHRLCMWTNPVYNPLWSLSSCARIFDVGSDVRINRLRIDYVRAKARELTIKFWRRRKESLSHTSDHLRMLPFAPKLIAEEILGLSFEEPWGIGFLQLSGLGIELAGQLDRTDRKILVAKKFSLEIQRFTGAHEIGHFVLHKEKNQFRESPCTDPAIRRPSSPHELEANIFAAELLMPAKVLHDLFCRRFPAPINVSEIDDTYATLLTNGRLVPSELRAKSILEVAEIVAKASSFLAADERALMDIFGVSATAMGIQLLDLGLVCGRG